MVRWVRKREPISFSCQMHFSEKRKYLSQEDVSEKKRKYNSQKDFSERKYKSQDDGTCNKTNMMQQKKHIFFQKYKI